MLLRWRLERAVGIVEQIGQRSNDYLTKKHTLTRTVTIPLCLAANNPGDPHSHAIIACPRFGFLRTRYCERLVNSCGLQGRAHKGYAVLIMNCTTRIRPFTKNLNLRPQTTRRELGRGTDQSI